MNNVIIKIPKTKSKANEKIIAIENNAENIIFACFREIFPEANGLFFFSGCNLSRSKSMMSFRIYPELVIKQSAKKPIKLIIIFSGEINAIPKTIPKKITIFLYHCFTLNKDQTNFPSLITITHF